MARPVIGICTPLERARWAAWNLDAFLLPRNYVDAVHRAGAMAMLLAPDPALVEDPDEVLDLIDGLMLAGGADIDPATYGAERHPETVGMVPERDAFEIALVRRALERDLPLLAICRGMQALNVSRGGTLHQHLPELVGHDGHREARGVFSEHDVTLARGSQAAAAVGERARVKSTHHQGLDRVGEGLEAVGWAEDGTVEAIEDRRTPFAVGVLWHPEEGQSEGLFEALVEEAGRFRAARGRDRRR